MDTLFAGAHSTVADFLKGSSNLLVPEYQREYSWGEENAKQLLHDIEHGISKLDSLKSLDDRIKSGSKFLGCVIQWERDAKVNEDFVDTPGISFVTRVCELIDGQQRISTIILVLCEIYLLLNELSDKLDESITEEKEFALFIDTVQDTWLLPKFARAGSAGAVPRHRPIIIRQGSDAWTHAGPVRYQSSIASYVHQLLENIDRGNPLRPSTVSDEIKEVVDTLREYFAERSRNPSSYLGVNYDQVELLPQLCTGRSRIDIEGYLHTLPASDFRIQGIVSLVAFAHYLLNYCGITVITSRNEDIALDMFQSLNATGVQLTAVQLLKPLISRAFKANNLTFASDELFKTYESVNNWLNSGRNSTTRTTQFFLKFGLAIFGDEAPSSLSGQRLWLLRTFEDFTRPSRGGGTTSSGFDLSKTQEFVRLMSHVKEYLRLFYFEPRDELFRPTPSTVQGARTAYDKFQLTHLKSGNNYRLTDPVIVAFMFLVDAKHDLGHTFFALCYAKFQESPANCELAAKGEFEKVVLAVTGCFVIWRACFSEKYPDSAYRATLSRINYRTYSGSGGEIGRSLASQLLLKRRSLTQRDPSMRAFNLSGLMANGLTYRGGMNAILRFVLILAAHRKTVSPATEEGLVISDPTGPDYLYPDMWLGSGYASIEHVAPQKLLNWTGLSISYWGSTLSTASTSIHSIGNLTLLSQALNSATPEDTVLKCHYYGGLIGPGAAAGVTPTASALMARSPLLSHLVPIYARLTAWLSDLQAAPQAKSKNVWDEFFIRRRAENIATEVSRDLIRWLRAR